MGSFRRPWPGRCCSIRTGRPTPLSIARAFAVLFLPYSLLGPFAGALMDRWDRRWVLVGANLSRLVLIIAIGTILAVRAGEMPLLLGALLANGFSRFVASGLSASLPHVVPREQVVTMNSVATAAGAIAAFFGANFMLIPRWFVGGSDRGASVIIFLTLIPVSVALLLSLRFGPRVLGPDDTKRAIHGSAVYAVITGWLHGARTVVSTPTVAAALSGLASHRMVVGINSLVILLLVHHTKDPAVGGLGYRAGVLRRLGAGVLPGHPADPARGAPLGTLRGGERCAGRGRVDRAGRAGLTLPVMVACSFFLGVTGQMIKLCADSAMQMDVDDAPARSCLRGAGRAVLGLVHRLDHGGRDADPRRRASARIRDVRVCAVPGRARRAQCHRPAWSAGD